MVEKKKTKSVKKAKSVTKKSSTLFAPVSKEVEESQTIRLLTICFTLLSLAFTAMAFWKYPFN